MHHEEDTRIWLPRSNESAAHCDAPALEVDKGEESLKQRLLLVLDDLGPEYDLFSVRFVLDLFYYHYLLYRHRYPVVNGCSQLRVNDKVIA